MAIGERKIEMKESPLRPLLRAFDFAAYVTAMYQLIIIKWGGEQYFWTAVTVCLCVCLFQLFRMLLYLEHNSDATAFNRADMVVISDDIVPLGRIAAGRLNGIYYMHSGRKEE
jgi:hypothetical protein